MEYFSKHTRTTRIKEINNNFYDVIVIGGGITGCGIALDAVTRGMKAVVIEMNDFASGTSSRSTKLIHGGLRYLKQFQVGVVAETGKEREIVYENGPHVTKPEWMLLPLYAGGTFGKISTSIGLRVYDFLAGVKKSERRSMLDVAQTVEKEPLLKREGLKGSGYYVEYRTDDARLTLEVLKEAIAQGAEAYNYLKVISFIYKNNKVIGVTVEDQLTKETYSIHGKKIINAAGPWVDYIREMDGSRQGKVLQLSKGVHIVFDGVRFPLKQAIYFDTDDGRMIFAIPRDGKTYVGTTDTFYYEKEIHPRMTEEDRTYLLRAINHIFPTIHVSEQDIESSWAGVRPLIYEEGRNASEISRKDEVWQSSSGLITIAGGKLTGYRHMAENVLDLITTQLHTENGQIYKPCQTKKLPISGGHVDGASNFKNFIMQKVQKGIELGLTEEVAEKLAHFYGSNVDVVYEYIPQYNQMGDKILPFDLYGSVMYAMEHEMTVTAVDYFMRRTGISLFNMPYVHEWKEEILHVMASYFHWTEAEIMQNTLDLDTHLRECVDVEA